MASVTKKAQPGTIDPTGSGSFMVVDCLGPFPAKESDPFLLLHAFGPMDMRRMPPLGMHPHRGFNEVPYFKMGSSYGTDPWNMSGEGEHAKIIGGQVQWGKTGSGIEHGMRKDESYDGMMMGFQLWVNLKTENKMDAPVFQNAKPDSLPLLEPAAKVKAKLLVGSHLSQSSPIDTMGIECQYVDYMLEVGGSVIHPRPEGYTSLFVYVYEGAGSFGATKVVAKQGEVMCLGPTGDVSIQADQSSKLGCLLLAGVPLKEPIIQHGPFVMSSRAQIMQAFEDYQRGRFLASECEYRLHTANGTEVTRRGIDEAYYHRRDRM